MPDTTCVCHIVASARFIVGCPLASGSVGVRTRSVARACRYEHDLNDPEALPLLFYYVKATDYETAGGGS